MIPLFKKETITYGFKNGPNLYLDGLLKYDRTSFKEGKIYLIDKKGEKTLLDEDVEFNIYMEGEKPTDELCIMLNRDNSVYYGPMLLGEKHECVHENHHGKVGV